MPVSQGYMRAQYLLLMAQRGGTVTLAEKASEILGAKSAKENHYKAPKVLELV